MEAEGAGMIDKTWVQQAGKKLAQSIGAIPPESMSVEGLRHVLALAYKRRADLNHDIRRAENALECVDESYRKIIEELKAT